jgi:hypothetical protein
MKRRRSFTKPEALETLRSWMWDNRMTQVAFVRWLKDRGIVITQAFLSEMLRGVRPAGGPKFKRAFKEITGITLVEGLIEEDKKDEQAQRSPRRNRRAG